MSSSKSGFSITPETKVGALLKQFPQLEDVLIRMAPEFKLLHNPVLKRTVAKVASLRQVAVLGKVPLADLINDLRKNVGVEDKFEMVESRESEPQTPPPWFEASHIAQILDARPLLESGEQPMQRVLSECRNLKSDQIYELITPFLPAPLIEAAEKQGYLVWSHLEEEKVVKTYLMLKP